VKLALTLAAISAGASYFGAMTYIGNAPNLMVTSIIESHGVTMPNFFLLRLYRLVRDLPAAAAVGGDGGVLPLAGS
jgi:Na+/H+ antiporter NhaD/arsenite permease-like protein